MSGPDFQAWSREVAALTDRCPHRKAPLSSGEVVGNDIQCGYHGLRFAADGACTRVPGDAAIGRNFRARSFPVRELHGLIFVWLGEAVVGTWRKPVPVTTTSMAPCTITGCETRIANTPS